MLTFNLQKTKLLDQKKYRKTKQLLLRRIKNLRKKKKKNIQAIGTPKNIGQAKYVGKLLSSLNSEELNDTAIVLSDETMLIPLINSIPQNVKNINVTMGYPLKNSNIFSFFYVVKCSFKKSI